MVPQDKEDFTLKVMKALMLALFVVGPACTTDFRGNDGDSDANDGTEDTAAETETDDPDLLADPDMPGDTDAADVLDDPDLVPDVPEDRTDCIPAVPFSASCERASAHPCPDGAVPGLDCTVLFEDMNGPRLDDSLNFSTRGQSDVCASFCQCDGFLTLEVGASEHIMSGPVKTVPSAIFYPPVAGLISIETTLVEAFSTDTPGQRAGIYLLQDDDSLITVSIVQQGDAKYIVAETWEDNNTLTPTNEDSTQIPNQDQHVHTIQISERGRYSWDIVTTGISFSVTLTMDFQLNEAGIFVGNQTTSSGLNPAYAWFDYICMYNDTY